MQLHTHCSNTYTNKYLRLSPACLKHLPTRNIYRLFASLSLIQKHMRLQAEIKVICTTNTYIYITIIYIILIDCYQFTNKKELKPHNSRDRVVVILPMIEHNTRDLIKRQTL